jgi:DNA-directed RNA polymerase beta' subunit
MYLSPKNILVNYRLNKDAFDYVIQQIKKKYYESIAHTAEMVGVIAAQSIGEPMSQMTLNSVTWDTLVLVKKNNEYKKTHIGEFIDDIMDNKKYSKFEAHPNNTSLGWIKDDQYEIMSCDENGKVSWKLIEAVTKHPVVNEDGSNTLVKVTTQCGRVVVATKAKSFLKRIDNKIQPVRGDELKVGDYLPIYEEKETKSYIVPDIQTKEWGLISLSRHNVETYMSNAKYEEDKQVLASIIEEDISYDQIMKIEEVSPPEEHPYVYDFTVKDTKNFNLYNGLCIRDTFHMAGVSAASKTVRGVPRLKELLSISKNMKTPVMRVHLKDHLKSDFNKSIEIMNNIKTVRFRNILKKSEIVFDPNDNHKEDKACNDIYDMFENESKDVNTNTTPWLIRFEFNREEMHTYKIDMIKIHQTLLDYYTVGNIVCKFSDDNSEIVSLRIKLKNIKEDMDMLTELKALEYNIINNISIKGIDKIENTTLIKEDNSMYDPITKKLHKNEEWIIFTEGTNFKEVMANEFVDKTKLYTNDIKEIYNVLGIEAARQALYTEILDVMESINVNYRHISLLVDVQTNKGTMLSIDRHGINRGDIGPLAKCSFEETTEKLIKAGIFSEYDMINGVSANVILGQEVPAGTGMVEIVMDEEKLMDLDAIEEEEEEEEEEDMDDEDDMCAKENFVIDFKL